MITLNTPEVTSITVDTVRLAYCELSFENPSVRAILSYGTTDADGNYTEIRRQTVDLSSSIDGMADALNSARDSFESLLLVAPPDSTPVLQIEATQVSETRVGQLQVGIKPAPERIQ